MRDALTDLIANSTLREYILWALMNVPGLPPIAQGIHILAVAVIVASSVMIALRFVGLAVPSQSPSEMIDRLQPFTWWALLTLLVTGSLFVIARPERYFYNDIALWKFTLLTVVLVLTFVLYRATKGEPAYWERSRSTLLVARSLSAASIVMWIAIIFAGRWIAYVDYLIY